MARKPRIHYPGACYHVRLRGNAGRDIFFENQDRSRFFFLLQEGIEKYNHLIHAYCLMTNHVHMVIQVGEIPLSRIMQNASFRYTRYINHRKKQVGHLFQGRFKALLIDVDCYLLELVRYIHNNPVRAGMVKTPEQYQWSSHVAYLNCEQVPWLSTELVLSQFSQKEKQEAIEQYRQFVFAAKDDPRQNKFHTGSYEGQILGDDRFIEQTLARISQKVPTRITLRQVIDTVCKQYKISQDDLSGRSRQKNIAEARAVIAVLVREMEHLSLTELGRELNRDLSGLSQAAGRLDRILKEDKKISRSLYKIRRDMGPAPICQA